MSRYGESVGVDVHNRVWTRTDDLVMGLYRARIQAQPWISIDARIRIRAWGFVRHQIGARVRERLQEIIDA